MHFLLGTLIVLGIIWLIVAVPAIRYVVFAVLAVAVVGFIVLLGNSQKQQEQTNRALEQQLAAGAEYSRRAALAIKITEVEVRNLGLRHPYLNRWEIHGLIQNNSSTELTGISFRLVLRDCANSTECLTVGDEIVSATLSVPPGQARAFEVGTDFKNLPARQTFQWTYSISGMTGVPR